MTIAGTRESLEAGGLTFDQSSVGVGGEADEVWDDRAILKAFDDALNTHTRKPVDGVEARKWNKHAAQQVAAQPSAAGSRAPPTLSSSTPPRGRASSGAPLAPSSARAAAAATGRQQQYYGQGQGHGFDAADRRFASLLAKGAAEASRGRGEEARALPAGIPGPWEPVAAAPGDQYGRGAAQDEGQRFEHARPGPHEPYARGQEYSNGAPNYPYPSRGAPYYPPPPHPPGGGAAGFEEGGLGRHGLPPPPPPPHPGVGPHAAAFQSLDGVPDDDLADLLLAWYYSGYYTGRYRAMQEARKPRNYRRHYAPPPTSSMPPASHAAPPPTPSSAYGGEGWGGESTGGWHGQQHAMPSPAASARGSFSRR